MTTCKDFDAEWPAVLELMSIYIEESRPLRPMGQPMRVKLRLSEKRVQAPQLQPYLSDWIRYWEQQNVSFAEPSWTPARKHTLEIEREMTPNPSGLIQALDWVRKFLVIPDPDGEPTEKSSINTQDPFVKDIPGDRYQPIEDALNRWISHFMKTRGVSHQKRAPDDIYMLEKLEIYPANEEFDELLLEYLSEFKPEYQLRYLEDALKRYPKANLSFERVGEIDRVAKTPDAERIVREAIAKANDTVNYVVRERGAWEKRPVSSSHAPSITPSVTKVRVEIFDRACPVPEQVRSIEVSATDLVIGREGNLMVDGDYASRQHCRLRLEPGGATLEDLDSRHGTYLNGRRLMPGQVLPVAGTVAIRLGSEALGNPPSYAEFPGLRVYLPQPKPASTATPIIRKPHPGSAQATPMVGMKPNPERSMMGAELVIQDRQGSRVQTILKTPFRVGRSKDCGAVIDEANEGVSREHLVIERLESEGAQVRLTGKHGAMLAGKPVTQSPDQEFLWRWNTVMELATLVKDQYPETPTLILKRLNSPPGDF